MFVTPTDTLFNVMLIVPLPVALVVIAMNVSTHPLGGSGNTETVCVLSCLRRRRRDLGVDGGRFERDERIAVVGRVPDEVAAVRVAKHDVRVVADPDVDQVGEALVLRMR